MSVIEMEEQKSGHLIALEGDTNVISTQLRLLPPSQKIMILPNLLESPEQPDESTVFDARAYIQSLQAAFSKRTETARSFLQLSTPAQPRLVFAIHGSVSARAACIAKIAENITKGNVREAESIFNELVKDGVAGLMNEEGVVKDVSTADVEHSEVDESEDALRSTDAEFLEDEQQATPTNEDFDPNHRNSRPDPALRPLLLGTLRSLEAEPRPARMILSKFNQDVPVTENPRTVQTILSMPSRRKISVQGVTSGQHQDATEVVESTGNTSQLSQRDDTDTDDDYYDAKSPSAVSEMTMPATPGVVFGEARLVDVQIASPKYMKKAHSLDGFGFRKNSFSDSSHPLQKTRSLHQTRGRPHTSAGPWSDRQRMETFLTLPRTTFARASQTTIRKSSTTSTSIVSPSSVATEVAARYIFVERGTDAEEFPVTKPVKEAEIAPFVPVFELVEDMIIHFTDDSPDEIFDSVVTSYKTGSYPIIPSKPVIATPSSPASVVDKDDPIEAPAMVEPVESPQSEPEPDVRPNSYMTTMSIDIGYSQDDEYDPFAVTANSYPSYSPEVKRPWAPKVPVRIVPSPEPSLKAEPTVSGLVKDTDIDQTIANKFVVFGPVESNNAISIQNSFRQLLNVHYPSHENYSQYYYPMAPEADRLWKPVFRNDENSPIGNEGRTVDQIIAFGCEEGVKKDFFFQLSGQIEKLGSKRDGLNRSGKLDIRYLISNIMQSHFNVPPTDSSPNPLSDPDLMASLLVPHIEAFLANNTSTRLLILHYSAADLPIVFALRRLLGADLLKISGILDTLASDPVPTSFVEAIPQPLTPSSPNAHPLSNQNTIPRRSSARLTSGSTRKQQGSTSTPLDRKSSLASSQTATRTSMAEKRFTLTASFAKADYLLPSTATDAEIVAFLAGIWKSLVERSAFYTPEPEPEPKTIIVERPPMPPPPTISPPVTRDRDSGYPPSSYAGSRSKVSRLTGGAPSSRADSITSTIRGTGHAYSASVATTRNGYAQSIASHMTTASERGRRDDKEWENFYIAEEDSEDDDYDKMILGRAMARIVPEVKKAGQKRNTKKALKWLGLA